MKQKIEKYGKGVYAGIVKRHPDGFGFFVPDDPELPDVYVPRKYMTGVMSNDRIEVKVQPEPGGQRWRGQVQAILHRAQAQVLGAFDRIEANEGVIFDRSGAWGTDLVVSLNNHPVKKEELVAVRITHYPDSPKGFRGEVIAVIGKVSDPQNDSMRVLHSQSIPFEFSKKAIHESEALPEKIDEKEISHRKDLRSHRLITIDGKTAKDFDDAVLVEKRRDGHRLWVAIADVSHYVKPGTALDEEAYERGTSTYFPNFVAPMLPERISNGLCSLVPKQDRLAFVCEMDLSSNGEVVRSEIYEAVICSHARVTYGEAQEVVEGRCPEEFKAVEQNILQCAELAEILMKRRFEAGSLNLEIPETEIILDETGDPIDVMPSERLFAHKLIEELMLVANVTVAQFLARREVPCLYRIHEEPKPDAIETLGHFLNAFGYQGSLTRGVLQKALTGALQTFSGHPKEHVLNVLALRSMAQAKYSPHNVGHFGLGFKDYAHFTSPIRRYPDLILHRILKSQVCAERGYKAQALEDLESAGTFLSSCEQRSVKAERFINSIKKARLMAKYLGQEFDGVVSSVTKFGMFVLLRQFDIDGLVRLDAIPGGPYEHDEEGLRLVAPRSGYAFAVGEAVKIVVAASDVSSGQIDFTISDEHPMPRPTYKTAAKFDLKSGRNRGPQASSKEASRSSKSAKAHVKKASGMSRKTEDQEEASKSSRFGSKGPKKKVKLAFGARPGGKKKTKKKR